MQGKFRVIDSGVVEGRLNIAIGQAIVEAHQSGSVPDTLRFLRFPPTALVGRHQALAQEINLDYCRQNDIGVARRITGGGAIFLDPGQLGWELAFSRSTLRIASLTELAREKACTPAQLALAWVLAQGDHIVPIPGTKRIAYLEQNAGALGVELTAADLERLDRLVPPGSAHGERYTAEGMKGVNA